VTVSAAFSRHRQRLLTDLGSLRQRTEDVAHARLVADKPAVVGAARLVPQKLAELVLQNPIRDQHCARNGGYRFISQLTLSQRGKSGWLQSLAQHFCATQRFLSSPATVGGRHGTGKAQETAVKSHSGLSHGMRLPGNKGGSSSSFGQTSSTSPSRPGAFIPAAGFVDAGSVAPETPPPPPPPKVPMSSNSSANDEKRGGKGIVSEKSNGASKSNVASSKLVGSGTDSSGGNGRVESGA
jgi:hypothetical protein